MYGMVPYHNVAIMYYLYNTDGSDCFDGQHKVQIRWLLCIWFIVHRVRRWLVNKVAVGHGLVQYGIVLVFESCLGKHYHIHTY